MLRGSGKECERLPSDCRFDSGAVPEGEPDDVTAVELCGKDGQTKVAKMQLMIHCDYIRSCLN